MNYADNIAHNLQTKLPIHCLIAHENSTILIINKHLLFITPR